MVKDQWAVLRQMYKEATKPLPSKASKDQIRKKIKALNFEIKLGEDEVLGKLSQNDIRMLNRWKATRKQLGHRLEKML